jgi:hypothetical protein
MAEIIDFKTKKKITTSPNSLSFMERNKQCREREVATGTLCTCSICVDKRLLAGKLVTISNWLCMDYMQKNKGNTLYLGDWLEIVTLALAEVQVRVVGKHLK